MHPFPHAFANRRAVGVAALAWLALATPGLLGMPATAQAAWKEELFQEAHLDVGPGGTLDVDVPDGDVVVRTHARKAVDVEIHLGSHDLEHAREIAQRMNLAVSRDGDRVIVRGKRPGRRFWQGFRGGFGLRIEVRVPERFNLDLDTDDGDISVGDLRGDVIVRTSDGDVDLGAIRGDVLEVATSDGDVEVEKAESARVEIETSDGDVHVRDVNAQRIELHTGDGDIQLGSVDGHLEVQTGDGDIQIARALGGVDAETGDGDIQIRFDRFGPTSLETSDGDVTIHVPEDLGAELDLRGGDVVLRRNLVLSGRVSEHEARGALNGGGPPLRVRTHDGRIVLSVGR